MRRLFLIVVLVILFLLMPITANAKSKYEIAMEAYYELFDELDTICDEDLEEWYLKYEKLANIYDKDRDTVSVLFEEEEIRLMLQVIETETYQADFSQKVNVANVLLNRYQYYDFFEYSTMKEIVTAPNQFQYFRTEISEDTINALNFAFEIKDTTNGSIGFRSDYKTETFNGWEYEFYDGAHWFYKIIEEEK